jgi:hypothetical protein
LLLWNKRAFFRTVYFPRLEFLSSRQRREMITLGRFTLSTVAAFVIRRLVWDLERWAKILFQ